MEEENQATEQLQELAATLTAIQKGLADVAAGRMIPMEQVRRELNEKYGVHE